MSAANWRPSYQRKKGSRSRFPPARSYCRRR
jgi:hypothetical protein